MATDNTVDLKKYEPSLDAARNYLSPRVPTAFLVGSIGGASVGYYIGEMAGLYSITYGFGLGMTSTAFYGGTYALKCARKKDDVYNYMISGSLNGGIIMLGLGGYKRGLLGAVLGTAAGALLKVGSDQAYDMTRLAWVRHRKYTIENSKERLLDVRKPQFHPKDSTLQRRDMNIIPKGPGGGDASKPSHKAVGKGEEKEKRR